MFKHTLVLIKSGFKKKKPEFSILITHMTFKHFYPNSIIKLNQSFIMNFHFMSTKEVEVFSLPIDIQS